MKQPLNEQFRRMQKLAGIITETQYRKVLLTEATDQIPGKDGVIILVSDYAKKHIMEHNNPGMGSVFKTGITEDEIIDMVKEVAPKVSGDGGAYELNKPGIGYDLVLSMDKAKALKDAKKGEVEKQEGPNKVKVISITTSQPLSSFASNRISLIIRKSNPQFLPDDVKTDTEIAKKIEEGKCYSLLTAFPGNPDIPKASEWNEKFAIIIPSGIKENMDNWGNETDDRGGNEQDYKSKPSLADFNYDKEAYKEYMEINFPGESISEGMQYFHNGAEMNQIINYDDNDIVDDLEALGQGSMDGQDFKPGETYNIGGNEYKIEPQGDEFKLVLVESISSIVNKALKSYRKLLKESEVDEYEITADDEIDGKFCVDFKPKELKSNDIIYQKVIDVDDNELNFYKDKNNPPKGYGNSDLLRPYEFKVISNNGEILKLEEK